jgi:hypothetical protein
VYFALGTATETEMECVLGVEVDGPAPAGGGRGMRGNAIITTCSIVGIIVNSYFQLRTIFRTPSTRSEYFRARFGAGVKAS